MLSTKDKTQTANYKYSVVSAVYNVEQYLGSYFKSLTAQTLSFEKHIYLILIDDGSTDNSAEIIKKWQKKYPNNITYLKKKNGGQSSARNLGLKYVTTQWVTFIDSDDFIDRHYFEKVDDFITHSNSSQLAMIACNMIYYFDKFGLYINRHPLRYRFKDNNLLPASDLSDKMQLSVNTVFFRKDLINKSKLRFDEKIKPNFEDAHFVNCYLIENNQFSVTFLETAKYYYRRRETKNSTIDTAWEKKELFDNVLRFGCLDLFKKADKKLGYVPRYLQRTILYHLAWYYKYLVDHNEKISFLSDDEQITFHNLLEQLFEYIDIDTIEQFELVGMGIFEKTAWLHLYKKIQLPYQTIFVHKHRNKLYFKYYGSVPGNILIEMNGKEIKTPKISQKEHTFVNKPFSTEFSFEIPIWKNRDNIFIQIDSKKTYIDSNGETFINKISINQIKTVTVSHIKNAIHNMARKLLLG